MVNTPSIVASPILVAKQFPSFELPQTQQILPNSFEDHDTGDVRSLNHISGRSSLLAFNAGGRCHRSFMMDTICRASRANSPTLKRSFTSVTNSHSHSPDSSTPVLLKGRGPKQQDEQRSLNSPKRRMSSDNNSPAMPIAAGTQAYQSHFPSFMTVYGRDQNASEPELSALSNKPDPTGANSIQVQSQTQTQLQHRDSVSTQASESTDSSPTTTISTADSSSLTDPSPSSSPESPITIVPLSSFAATSFGIHSLDDLRMSDRSTEQLPTGFVPYERPMTSPSPRKPRNTKGLALRLPAISVPEQVSAPASPSFIKPPLPKPKKKPSLLSLQTPANAAPMQLPRLNLDPPPTPAFGRSLKHSYSEPQFSILSPGPRAGPEGGMQLPAFQRSKISGLSTTFRKPTALKESSLGATIDEEDSPIRTQMANRSLSDIGGDSFDQPASHEDAQSPGYPHGPVEIYSPNVFLYLEPTAEEASRFDVVMNVAREVKNPFKPVSMEPEKSPPPKLSFDPMEIDRAPISIPESAASISTFQTAFEYPVDSQITPTESSPTTPKPNSKNEPEYFHIPWDHNTDISKDLMNLCETIEARTREGKRVLVHCQQGASRSASLIIAYGLYMNPTLSVNDAYHAAQAKSKWISPNMKLMYALQDFQKEVERKKLRPLNGMKFGSRSDRRSPTKHRMTMSADAVDSNPREPQTAPLPSENRKDRIEIGSSPGDTPIRPASTPDFAAVSPGPTSAPSSYTWTPRSTPIGDKDPNPEPTFTGLWSPALKSESPKKNDTFLQPVTALRTVSSFSGRSSFAPFPSTDSNLTTPSSGFGSHRKEVHLALPSLVLARSNGSSSSSSSSSAATVTAASKPVAEPASDIKPQFISLAPSTFNAAPQTPALWSPRVQEMTAHPIHPFAPSQTIAPSESIFPNDNHDIIMEDSVPEPSLMSPRATEFTMTPFARPHLPHSSLSFGSTSSAPHSSFAPYAAQHIPPIPQPPTIPNFSRPRPFGTNSPPRAGFAASYNANNLSLKDTMAEMGFATPEKAAGSGFAVRQVEKTVTPPKKVDPRSPAISGEAGILRSIDDVL